MERLDWGHLLSTRRQRQSSAGTDRSASGNGIIARSELEADYDRIVGSSSVRRLQDKAQVFPLQENDFTRTRLTHSIEVSALARSLGKAVGRQLESRNIFTAEMTEDLAALLQTAGLIHDLGNPPFGHYGEVVIRQWFKEWFESDKLLGNSDIVISEQEKNDFLFFDGNVQNLRIITKLQTLNDQYGANFTYATLATVIKYPWKSNQRPGGKKKFGYFKSEEDLVNDICAELRLDHGVRHPATYLLEAADDIIYICDDIEDGTKKGYINWDAEYAELKKKMMASDEYRSKYQVMFERIDAKIPDERMDEEEKRTARVRNFRNYVQGFLFQKAVEEFIRSYDQIMCGSYEYSELLHEEDALISDLKGITAERCFSCHEVLALELVGDKVIRTLLEIFVKVLTENTGADLLNTKTYAGKIFRLISPNFVYITVNEHSNIADLKTTAAKLDALSVYDKLHLAVDFISGMTDSYAVNLYKELAGIKLPG